MSPYQLGLILRLVGPAIQLVGIVLFLTSDPTAQMAGISTRVVGLSLIAVGLLPVIVGILLSARRPARPRPYAGLRLDDDETKTGHP
ncbi:MAG: hypothetical protein KatS3mg108_3715 [Isosphaeraceae bacterium]|nr:MAG: hypothetical protein KatS3mg108_3715 [Isosphaeraceae bacterium]